jgi:pimeloyl-ACP methyl ester carboxylesterase
MTWLAILLLGYGSVVAMLYFGQETMLFPGAGMTSQPMDGPLAPERLQLTTEDGAVLHGLLFQGSGRSRELLLGFGGNAQDAEYLGHDLAGDFPELDVVVFHYRGFGPSSGRPGQTALTNDAVAIHDAMVERLRPGRVFAIGVSLGSSVAAYLSEARDLAGIVLVTPFDSIEAIARERYFWVPVGLLLKHRFPTVEFMADNGTPVAVIAAAEDRVVRPERTRTLVEQLDTLVFERTLEGATHNTLYELPIYELTLRAAFAAVQAHAGGAGAANRDRLLPSDPPAKM